MKTNWAFQIYAPVCRQYSDILINLFQLIFYFCHIALISPYYFYPWLNVSYTIIILLRLTMDGWTVRLVLVAAS